MDRPHDGAPNWQWMKYAESLEKKLTEIEQWANAYPEDVFIPPTVEEIGKIHELCKEHLGFGIDRFSGDIYRRILKGVKKIISDGS